EIPLRRIHELRIARHRIAVQTQAPRKFQTWLIGEKVGVHLLAPRLRHSNRPVLRTHYIVPKHVAAVLEPDVGMKRIVDDDIVLDRAAVTFTQFQAAVPLYARALAL